MFWSQNTYVIYVCSYSCLLTVKLRGLYESLVFYSLSIKTLIQNNVLIKSSLNDYSHTSLRIPRILFSVWKLCWQQQRFYSLKLTHSITFTTRTWCLKQRGRKSGTWWPERSSDSAHLSRRCAAAPCLWVRSWIISRRTWMPCRLNCTPGGGRTRSMHRLCCRSRGGVGA